MNDSLTRQFLFLLPWLFAVSVDLRLATAQSLELNTGDRISIIGNTLAERMQHDGWLETMWQARFPDRQLVFRNLGFSGDELATRLRSKDFGTTDEWLRRCETDVVLAMFGYNESFAGDEGLKSFREELTRFVIQTRTQKYNGESPPAIVLVSPAACEELRAKSRAAPPAGIPGIEAHMPRFSEINTRLASYTDAMRKVANTEQVLFVDVFQPTLEVWQSSTDLRYTINGVHLNEAGNQVLAEIITQSLFGPVEKTKDPLRLTSIREAVRDKNWHWFHRYRTTDGYSIYGGRADLAFSDDQTNREVAAREMEILDYLTAQRDMRIHARTGGGDYMPDDDSAPRAIPVVSNKPGEGPDATHVFLGGVEAITQMKVHEGMTVRLFASEEQFPELASPVQMSFDPCGRLWVAVWPSYPHWEPGAGEMNDKLLIFSDGDGDGSADKVTVFADKLHNPTGFEFWNGGVIVAQAPDLWFLKDTDGDDVADVRMRILHGLDSADTHHTSNSFTMGPDGGLYFQEGTFHHSQIESPLGPPLRLVDAGVFRYEPRRQSIEAYITYPFANPHGHVFDYWGQDFVTDGTGNVNYYAAPFSGRLDYPQKHSPYFPFFEQWVRPSGATEILSGGNFPDDLQGNYLIANVIGFQGLLQYRIHNDESGFSATEVEPIVSSTDPNFRPVDIEMGPDGAIWFIDWQNPIIGHMQHNLRDPNRDKVHGRVYRVTFDRRPLDVPVDLTRLSIAELLDQLKSPFNRARYRTRLELGGRDGEQVLAAVTQWVAGLSADDPQLQHHLLEALWVTRQHLAVSQPLLRRLLRSQLPEARAAAVRVLGNAPDEISDRMELLERAVNDPHPRVRLEAVRAVSFRPSLRAAEIALQVLRHPRDRFIDYCLNETMRACESFWRDAASSGQPWPGENEPGLRYIMERMSPGEIALMARTPVVLDELLSRPGVLHETRMKAAADLARERETDGRAELLAAIARLDASDATNAESVLADLTHLFLHGDGRSPHATESATVDHVPYIPRLVELAARGRRAVTRQIAFAMLIRAGQPIDLLWNDALSSPDRFRDLVAAMALVDDPALKASLAPRVMELFSALPVQIEEAIGDHPGTVGRYVRIELPGEARTLTLAEVEVFSEGRNVAQAGTATQSSTQHGGGPELAIDGETSPLYESGKQSHTIEDQSNPWWEVDLGREYSLDRLVVWNRNEEEHGQRLEGFTIRALNDLRQPVFEKSGIAAPRSDVEISLAGSAATAIRNAAIEAIVNLAPGEQGTFEALADLIGAGTSRSQAVRGLARLPGRSWSRDRIEPLVENLIDWLAALSTRERTRPPALDEISLARKLVTALPAGATDKYLRQLDELGVNVIVLRPIPHRMQYDRSQFFVEAGKPFQLVLDNTDIMPHNVVITSPGAYARVGIAAELMATDPDAARRGYVPALPEVLHASRMLQAGQVQQMELLAPADPGDYPYVCTYPGHWRRMYGVMHVVKDLSTAPIEALVPTVDAEIAARPFVREWTRAELEGGVHGAQVPRAFERGRALFTELSCIQCHRIGDGEGGEVGPNLRDTLDKLKRGELDRAGLLTSLIEPSAEIAEQYRTWIVQDIDGRVHTGLIAERSDESIRLVANPLDHGEPVTIAVDDIEEVIESRVSMMPAGLLNTCEKQDILALLQFMESGGADPDSQGR